VCEEGVIRQVPEPTGVIGHGVQGARNVVVARMKAMSALEEGVEAEKVGAGGGRSGRAFGGPRDRCPVVAVEPNGSFVHMAPGG